MAKRLIDYVEGILVQFSFSNSKLIPDFVPRESTETAEQSDNRKSLSNGIKLFPKPLPTCSLMGFDPEALGLKLVDVYCQTCLHRKKSGQKYQMVRFRFCPKHYVVASSEITQHNRELMAFFRSLCDDAFWQLRSFSNPRVLVCEKSNVVLAGGKRNLSINLEFRQPRYQFAGTKNKKRKNPSAEPRHYLFVDDEDIKQISLF